jgi:phosphoenolpyruvate carboxykinase (ATP)
MLGGIKGSNGPPLRSPSPGPLAEDFARQQIFKQSRGNFHSSSLTSSIITMVANNVNKTALHPSGIQ